jgi:hypothetical protein
MAIRSIQAPLRSALAALALLAIAEAPALAQHTFDGNILFNVGAPFANLNGAACGANLLAFVHNDVGTDPLLPSAAFPGHDFVPAPGSIALERNDPLARIQYAVADTCPRAGCAPVRSFVQTCYRGAVPPAGYGADWSNEAWVCWPTAVGDAICEPANAPFVFKAGAQAASETWTAANTYVLQGKVNYLAGTTLTIEPGTKIIGDHTLVSYLVIERGARIIANGTPTSPIVLTSDRAVPIPGDIGGLVIHGRAIANCADCLSGASCVSEGNAGDHCGTDDCDDSGEVSYFRIQYSGVVISLNNELNAFTFNSVGNGTDAHHLEAILSTDDAFEWFGGNANYHHLISASTSDDDFDHQMGFRGTVQFGIGQKSGLQATDKGIEGDNNEFSFNAPCRSNPLYANLTLIGTNFTAGIHLRRGTDAHIFNSIVQTWTQGVRVEHIETCARGTNAQPPPFVCGGATGVDMPSPAESAIRVRAFPNPVAATTRFAFDLPSASHTKIEVFDVGGRLVASVLDRTLDEGSHSVSWNPVEGLTNGAYFYRVATGGHPPVMGMLMLVR